MTTTPAKRAALYVRVSAADRSQTVENQLRPLRVAAGAWNDRRPRSFLPDARQTRAGPRPSKTTVFKNSPGHLESTSN